MTVREHPFDPCCPCVACREHVAFERGHRHGYEAHRTHVRRIVSFHAKEAHGVFIVPSATIMALLGEGED